METNPKKLWQMIICHQVVSRDFRVPLDMALQRSHAQLKRNPILAQMSVEERRDAVRELLADGTLVAEPPVELTADGLMPKAFLRPHYLQYTGDAEALRAEWESRRVRRAGGKERAAQEEAAVPLLAGNSADRGTEVSRKCDRCGKVIFPAKEFTSEKGGEVICEECYDNEPDPNDPHNIAADT